MPIQKQHPVFACACTAFGFKSLFGEIFRPEDYARVYILKGSCGSGKSHIIGKLAGECEKRGRGYELFACSFDPASYDGIIISEPRICVVDGTSPHTLEPRYPGAVEIVVNTGGLGETNLSSRRDEIISLYKKSNDFFGKSYSFLRAALEVQNNLTDIITDNFQFGKMFSAINRFCARNFTIGSGYSKNVRLTGVYCKDGYYESDAFFQRAAKKCLVLDKYGCAHLLLDEILQAAVRSDQPAVVSLSPLDFETLNGIYLPECDMAFATARECSARDGYYHVFNMARFVDKNSIRQSKYKIRFLKKCFEQLTQGAVSCLGEAYHAHMELESIYTGNLDFSLNDQTYRNLCKAVF